MSKKNKYPEIQNELRERQAASQAIRQKIHQSSGRDRYDLWDEKRSYGSVTRALLLAYALLRGVPYRVVEPKSDPHTMWWVPGAIEREAARFEHVLTKEQIKAWLAASVVKATSEAA